MNTTFADASQYSINGGREIAYQIDYSDGTQVRAVVAAGGRIRKEYKARGEWKPAGAAYVVRKNRTRQGERIIAAVERFLAA